MMKINLSTRLILSMAAGGLVPLIVLVAFSLKQTKTISRMASEEMHTLATSSLDIIERNLFERYGDVQAFATNRVLDAADWSDPTARDAITTAINNYVRLYGIYNLSMVLDDKGKVVAVNTVNAKDAPINSANLIGKDFSRADWFVNARDGRFTSSEILSGTVVTDVARDADAAALFGPETLVVGYSAPITGPNGAFRGVWRNLADFTLVEDIIRGSYDALERRGIKSGEITMANKSGLILAKYDPAFT